MEYVLSWKELLYIDIIPYMRYYSVVLRFYLSSSGQQKNIPYIDIIPYIDNFSYME